MRKKHAASEVVNMTLCGHETTPGEFQKILQRKSKYINCKRCLQALQLRELIKEEHNI
tara:strand:- start:248 stop:421 length:174 start_codon:yes stop_codon:yes gene_type:complete